MHLRLRQRLRRQNHTIGRNLLGNQRPWAPWALPMLLQTHLGMMRLLLRPPQRLQVLQKLQQGTESGIEAEMVEWLKRNRLARHAKVITRVSGLYAQPRPARPSCM